jgi:hypothetical protein
MPVRPSCFMIMPYGRKPTGAAKDKGPAEIDFNALWDRGYVPVIEALGYEPVRADQDTDALIIGQMLERLFFADLVLADMTTPNGNVYYEVGIRHAAKKTGCVLLAAEWSARLFDVAQMRTITYPLPEGEITEQTAKAFREMISPKIIAMANGVSPMHLSLPGYPGPVDPAKALTMRKQMTDLAAFQTKVRAVRVAPRKDRMPLALKLIASDGTPPLTYAVALALSNLLRDSVDKDPDWVVVRDFLRGLPSDFQQQPDILDHRAFASAKAGSALEASAEIEILIETAGGTPERFGLLGGRYKSLANDPPPGGDRMEYLARSIDAYERGMDLDLNQYYCSGNLARLYRQRGDDGDEERAENVGRIAVAACERAIRLKLADEWGRSTLLGAAFDSGDADKAEKLAKDVIREGAAGWKLKTTLKDLAISAGHVNDQARRERLQAVIDRLAGFGAHSASEAATA